MLESCQGEKFFSVVHITRKDTVVKEKQRKGKQNEASLASQNKRNVFPPGGKKQNHSRRLGGQKLLFWMMTAELAAIYVRITIVVVVKKRVVGLFPS